MATTYAQAGVDIDAGDQLVRRIKRAARATFSRRVLNEIGAFGSFFDARFPGYSSPVLVSSVDGVGTKLKVAQLAGRHDTVGQDLVNHCVNDILVCGARPLFFLDYFAAGKLDVGVAETVIRGFAKACRANQCALVGGETAEMPGFYGKDEYDLAGAIVGVVERTKIIDGERICKGDVLIGVASSGLHTNGYSLARRVLLRHYHIDEYVAELGSRLADVLLAVHRSYKRSVTGLLDSVPVHGLSHITGGGIVGNTRRIIPRGRGLSVDWNAWTPPAIFRLIKRLGRVSEEEMRRTFNLGVGLVVIVPSRSVDSAFKVLSQHRERAFVLGEVT